MHFATLSTFVAAAMLLAQSAAAAPAPGADVVSARASPAAKTHHAAPAVLSDSAWKPTAAASSSDTIHYSFNLIGENEEALEQRMLDIASSNGEWLSHDELKKYVGASEKGRAQLLNTLEQHGIPGEAVEWNKLGNSATVKSTVAQASKLFGANFHDWTHATSQQSVKAKTMNYTVPAELAAHVKSVSHITAFTKPRAGSPVSNVAPRLVNRDSEDLASRALPSACSSGQVTPECRAALYNYEGFTPKSSDPSIAILVLPPPGGSVGLENSDLQTFFDKYKPSSSGYKVDIDTFSGGENSINYGNASAYQTELNMDVAIVAGSVPPIKTSLILPGQSATSYSDTFKHLIDMDESERPAVLTISFGGREDYTSLEEAHTDCSYAQQLGSLGTTVVGISGDWGVDADHPADAGKCPPFHPVYPAGCPYFLSVGATQLSSPGKPVNYDDNGYWSGAGFSNYFPTPSYQKSATAAYIKSLDGSGSQYYNASGRGYPDVAATGADVPYVSEGKTYYNGAGTSASTPTVASIIALLNSARKAAGKGTVGWVNPTLYENPGAFDDITTGSALGCPNGEGFYAGEGWDPVGGLGTPDFAKLRKVFGA